MKWLNFVLLLFFIPAMAGAGSAYQGDSEVSKHRPEAAGWIESGKTYKIDFKENGKGNAGGRFARLTSSRYISALFTLSDTLWIGSEGGLYCRDRITDSLSADRHFPAASVRVITADDDGRLWVGCDEGIWFRDSFWRRYDSSVHPFFRNIRDITPGDRKIWIATFGGGCGYISEDSLTVFTEEDSLLDDRVRCIVEETPHQIWFGTASGVCRADSFSWQGMRYGAGIPIGSINDLIFDEGRSLFIAVERNGVSRYKFGGVTNFTGGDGLPGWNINQFSLTLTGKLMAAGEGGVSYYDGSGWTPHRLTGTPLERYSFMSIHHDISDNMYLGTDEGLILLEEREAIKKILLPQAFPSRRVMKITSSGGTLFFITSDGIYTMNKGYSRLEMPQEWYTTAINGVAVGTEGELWVSTRFGILRYSSGKWEVFDRRNGLPTEHMTCVAQSPEGDLWFGTFENGVLRFAGDRWFHFTIENGLPDNRVKDILFDLSGRLWLLTDSGRMAYFSNGAWVKGGPPVSNKYQQAGNEGPEGFTEGEKPGLTYLSPSREGAGKYLDGICLGRGISGNCAVATKGGIYINYGGKWSRTTLPDTGRKLIPTAVMGTAEAEIWLGTRKSGLFILRRGEWVRPGNASGFSAKRVMTLLQEPAGSIWIGTGASGIFRFFREKDDQGLLNE